MEMVVKQNMVEPDVHDKRSAYGSRPATADGSASEVEDGGWMEGASVTSHPKSPSKRRVHRLSRPRFSRFSW